jgi:S1-C subfamily serine protease
MDMLVSLSNGLAAAVERASRAVVAVNARPRLPSTGIHWRPGVVVTADHTVKLDEQITITTAEGPRVTATLAGRDPGTDLAVLRAPELADPPATIGDAARLKVGHFVVALGHGPRASWGVVSALGGRWRTWRGGEVEQLVRPDLVLYPGFSGGPLVDVEGRVVGVNTSGLSRQMALALPVSTVFRVSDELLLKGRVARGYLGVGLQTVRLPESITRQVQGSPEVGMIVVNVERDGPAASAGLLIGDVLIAIDGKAVGDTDDVQAVLDQRVGATVTAALIRAGARKDMPVTVGERPQRGQ